jgi:uncharacterized protein (DUF2147 family)
MYYFSFHKRSTGRAGAIAGSLLALALLAPATEAQGPARGVTGLWIDHTGQGAVEIGPCGERVCGRVVWLKDPAHKSKSGKLICGTQILGDLRPRQNNTWESGWIYNPEDEERFSAEIKLKNENTLLVTGYLGIKFLGETYTWKRATTDLNRCADKQAI